jgi:hypothetical protein
MIRAALFLLMLLALDGHPGFAVAQEAGMDRGRCPGGNTECLGDPEAIEAAAPQVPIQIPGVTKKAPTNVVVIGCRVDDFTGQAGRHDPAFAAKDWRDLEWHIEHGELQCKREVSKLEDQAVVMDPSGKMVKPLNADFGDLGQCSHAGAYWAPLWEAKHKGWAVMAIGCPVAITDERGVVKAWKMPECPRRLGKLEGITCNFDESQI